MIHIDNFFKYVEKTEKCWIWNGYRQTQNSGYKLLPYGRYSGKMAHRLSWEIHNSKIPKGLNVLHKCDVPYCVNPDHLFLGTQKDNIRDGFAKGRIRRDGEYSPFAKLNWDLVNKIRFLYKKGNISYYKLSKMFGVNDGHISNIINNKKWIVS